MQISCGRGRAEEKVVYALGFPPLFSLRELCVFSAKEKVFQSMRETGGRCSSQAKHTVHTFLLPHKNGRENGEIKKEDGLTSMAHITENEHP